MQYVITVCHIENPEDDGGTLSADNPLARLEVHAALESAMTVAEFEVAELVNDDEADVEYGKVSERTPFAATVTTPFTVYFIEVAALDVK